MQKLNVSLLLISLVMSAAICSHIDEDDADFKKFQYDKVIFRTPKDCSLDKHPDVRTFLEVEAQRYPELDVFIADGVPRFELLKDGKIIDTIRVHRYDIKGFKKILTDFGLKRDDSYTWEKKAAKLKLEQEFKKGSFGSSSTQSSNKETIKNEL